MSPRQTEFNSIQKVCELLENEYIVRILAKDQATVDLWHSDTKAFLENGYHIREFNDEHRSIVDFAVNQWENRETMVLKRFENSHNNFIEWFSLLHQKVWQDKIVTLRSWKDKKDLIYYTTELSRQIVGNIGWCRDFGFFLPKLIHENNFLLVRSGLVMSSIFYLEMIAKLRDESQDKESIALNVEYFEKIDSYWRIAKSNYLKYA